MMHGFGWGCCGFGGFGSLGWIGWIVNLVITVGILVGLVLLVIWAVRRISRNQSGSFFASAQTGGQGTALEVLQTRYASGEITRDEYRQMLEDIR